MSIKKKLMSVLLCLLILAAMVLGLAWHMRHYMMIDLRFYPKDAQVLDLREDDISIAHYEKICRRLPEAEILWNIPFREDRYPQETEKLTVTELQEPDLKILGYFEALKTLDARNCREYELLMQLKQTRPELEILYQVELCGESYAQDARSVRISGITAEELARFPYLPDLAEVCVEGTADAQVMADLEAVCDQRGISFLVMIGGNGQTRDTKELQLETISQQELQLLALLPELERVHIQNPQASARDLVQMTVDFPELDITWEKEIMGIRLRSDVTEIDLMEAISPEGVKVYKAAAKAPVQGDRDEITYLFATDDDYPLPNHRKKTKELIAQVEEAMAYFPSVKTVNMCGVELDNEAMADFRDAHRDEYKVIWAVQCGGMVARTDTPYFMPTKYHVYYFQDDESENLKYCEDMICVDLGHMSIKHVEWAAYMPKLQYLILAHSDVRSIEPLRNCKDLKFLEVDWSAVKDFSPLLDCKKLEDLNLGNTYGNFEVIQEMSWLKNLWMVGCSRSAVYKISQALPEVNLMATGTATVANGWRNLPNYYAMRDIMNMYYMVW